MEDFFGSNLTLLVQVFLYIQEDFVVSFFSENNYLNNSKERDI